MDKNVSLVKRLQESVEHMLFLEDGLPKKIVLYKEDEVSLEFSGRFESTLRDILHARLKQVAKDNGYSFWIAIPIVYGNESEGHSFNLKWYADRYQTDSYVNNALKDSA